MLDNDDAYEVDEQGQNLGWWSNNLVGWIMLDDDYDDA
jgi:hypothetical protein